MSEALYRRNAASSYELARAATNECGFRGIADRIPTQAGQRSDDCGQPMTAA